MHHTRNYSYDDQHSSYPSSHQGTSYGAAPQSYSGRSYDPTTGQYYVSTQAPPHAQNAAYPRSMSVSPEAHRFSGNANPPNGYYSSNGSSSTQAGYPPGSASYYDPSQSYPQSSMGHSQSPRFIPTPSELATNYPGYSADGRAISPSQSRRPEYYSAEYHQQLASSQLQHGGRIPSSRPRSTAPTSNNAASGERFPCEKCGKTFSRSHDRKRHHETQHLAQPVMHRCRFCVKEFSRADSLKRHLDNGCDEMP
ncbi:hypothetical protein HGRIS_002932 [Hohenbuehelia grisea]|uniref:C2H2-type domain-containing protein n=1 Tax=Hohenbuehelia grisea TaxID=104357 RepID=A0ABR3JM62_9AGAR